MATFNKLMLSLLILSFVFLLNFAFVAGQEGCIVPTVPGYVEGIETWLGPCECDGGTPDAYTLSDTVTRATYTTVWVDSGGLACPPYDWSLGGTGFHFSTIAGPTTIKTNADSEVIELWADDTACGSAFITVTDACGEQTTISVREPNSGGWYLVEQEQCSYWQRGYCAYCTCDDIFEIGAYRYHNSWIGDKACQMKEETCGPYGGGADLKGNKCYVVGYYTPAYCNTFFGRSKWEWRCPP
jgi:hypothetical protein